MILLQAQETFATLLHDKAHWEFELFVGLVETIVIDLLFILLIWDRLIKPLIKKRKDKGRMKAICVALKEFGEYDIGANLIVGEEYELNHQFLPIISKIDERIYHIYKDGEYITRIFTSSFHEYFITLEKHRDQKIEEILK